MCRLKTKVKSKHRPFAQNCGIEIHAEGLTKREKEMLHAELRRVLARIRYERKRQGLSALSYLIELK